MTARAVRFLSHNALLGKRIMNKNDFVFCCITGLPMAGREAGAENDGWKTRPSLDEAIGYHDALESGDLGPGPQSELAKCSGSFDAETVAAMLDEAKRELVDTQECQCQETITFTASDAVELIRELSPRNTDAEFRAAVNQILSYITQG
jgi:hypothetical protein